MGSREELNALVTGTLPEELVARLSTLHPDDAAEVLAMVPEDMLQTLKPGAAHRVRA